MGKTCKVRHHVLNNQTVDAILTGRANVTTCQVQDIILIVQAQLMHLTGLKKPTGRSGVFYPVLRLWLRAGLSFYR